MSLPFRWLLPWRDFAIDTCWSPERAATELGKLMAPSTSAGDGYLPFAGTPTSPTEFQFSRRITYRNSFLPTIRASVEPSRRGGARVRVRLRLHPFVLGFIALWMTGAIGGAVGGLLATLAGEPKGLFALGFPAFGLALTCGGFGFEADRAEELLRAAYADAPALPDPPDTGEAYR